MNMNTVNNTNNNEEENKMDSKFLSIDELTLTSQKDIAQALYDYGKHTPLKDILEDVSRDFINTLAHDSVRSKGDLRELFRKSPVWNEDLQAIVINGTRTHNPDYLRVADLAWKILDPVWKYADFDKRHKIGLAVSFFSEPTMNGIDRECCIKAINSLSPKAYAPGKKLSRVFKQLCVDLGVADETQGSKFQQVFAQFADELTAKKLDFKLYVSINPAHFVTMSNPKGDERGQMMTSCHSFNSTNYPYNNGCAGYARDKTSFIVFTVDDPNNPESFNNRKTSRQVFAYRPGSGLLLQSRMYNTEGGVYGAAEDAGLYRDLIQREISELEGVPNLWKTRHSYDRECEDFVVVGTGFGGYADWNYSDFDCHISVRADCDPETVSPLVVGTYGLCVKCGDTCSKGMYCGDCNNNCYCEDCQEYVYETFIVWGYHGNRFVCQRCLDNNYTRCERCGEYHPHDDITWVDDDAYCEDCLEQIEAHCCEQCGEWHYDDDMNRVHDYEWVCDGCLDRYYEKCADCDEWHPRRKMQTVYKADGSTIRVCSDCADDYRECPHCSQLIELTDEGTCPHCGVVVEEKEVEAV